MKLVPTEELYHEIKNATDPEDFLAKNSSQMLRHNLSEHLRVLLSQKNMTRAEVVRGSLLDRSYVYQIFSGEKTPSRDTLIALSFGLRLTDSETQKMLKLSGNRELYARDKRDALILFAITHGQTLMQANELLYRHELTLLGTQTV